MAKVKFPVGVLIGDDRLDENLARAAAAGAEIVQIWCTRGALSLDKFNSKTADRRRKRLEMTGLTISALCGDLGLGFTNPKTVEEAVSKTSAMLKTAAELGVPVLTSHIGHLHEPTQHQTGLESLKKLGDAAEKAGVTFASETGGEDGPLLREFLDELGHRRIKVNFDPANLLMRGFDLDRCVDLLGPHIAHAHAKDALFKQGEVPIGAGDVPWPSFLKQLDKAGYTGALAIEREGGDTWWDDVRMGLTLLKKWR